MTGTFLNAGAIVVGGVAGLAFGNRLSPAIQARLRLGLAGLTTYAALSMMASGLQAGGLRTGVRQVGMALLALMVGGLLGRTCRLQRGANRLGRWARDRFAAASTGGAGKDGADRDARRDPVEGFITCTLLFCIGPMAILGPIQDGLEGRWQVLAVKSLLDGLSTMGFVAAFGWAPIGAAVPVLLYQGAITLAARRLEPVLASQDLKDMLNVTGGLIVAMIPLVILEVRKVPLADYLPALPVSLLLAYLGWR